jgi:hypothetical protein
MKKETTEAKKCCLDCGVFLYRFYKKVDGKCIPIGWYCPICKQTWFDEDLAKELGPDIESNRAPAG